MQNSQASEPIVAQLLEIDTKLAAQEVELTLQLHSVQEKRHSLKNVIGLFSSVDTATLIPVKATVVEELAESQEVASKLDEAITPTSEAAPQPVKPQIKRNAVGSKPKEKFTSTKHITKEPAIWQQYLQDEFTSDSLSVAVFEVMQQQPDRVLEITNIIDAIFVKEIPKEVRTTARERISNILSVGAKKGKWHRGDAGKYSMLKIH